MCAHGPGTWKGHGTAVAPTTLLKAARATPYCHHGRIFAQAPATILTRSKYLRHIWVGEPGKSLLLDSGRVRRFAKVASMSEQANLLALRTGSQSNAANGMMGGRLHDLDMLLFTYSFRLNIETAIHSFIFFHHSSSPARCW